MWLSVCSVFVFVFCPLNWNLNHFLFHFGYGYSSPHKNWNNNSRSSSSSGTATRQLYFVLHPKIIAIHYNIFSFVYVPLSVLPLFLSFLLFISSLSLTIILLLFSFYVDRLPVFFPFKFKHFHSSFCYDSMSSFLWLRLLFIQYAYCLKAAAAAARHQTISCFCVHKNHFNHKVYDFCIMPCVFVSSCLCTFRTTDFLFRFILNGLFASSDRSTISGIFCMSLNLSLHFVRAQLLHHHEAKLKSNQWNQSN